MINPDLKNKLVFLLLVVILGWVFLQLQCRKLSISHSSNTVFRFNSCADLFLPSYADLSFWRECYPLYVLLVLTFSCCFTPHSFSSYCSDTCLICSFFPFHFALVNQDMFTVSSNKNFQCVCVSQLQVHV